MSLLVLVTLGSTTLAACGGIPSAEKTVTVTASNSDDSSPSTDTPSASDTDTATSPDGSESSTEAAEPTPEPQDSTGPPVLRNSGAPKSLTLTDIFEHYRWEEGLYQTPQSATPTQGMATRIDCSVRSMEIRLAQATGSATIEVAQALDSPSSKVTLEFKLFADQRLIDTKLVKFNQVSTLSAKLDGVSALALEVKRAPGSDECESTAVITKFLLTPQ